MLFKESLQLVFSKESIHCGGYTYQYDLKDHLGDVRVTFDQYNNAVRVLQEDEYYAFGLRKSNYDYSNNNRHLYNGKELQVDLANQYDYGARFYDPVIGRFNTVDPYSEFFPWMTNYQYASNGPVSKIDLDGLEGILFFEETALVPEVNPIENLAKAGGEFQGEKIQAPETGPKFEWHHLIPKSLIDKMEIIKKAIKEGFGFEDEENLSPQEKFSRATGKGTHGKHPKYTAEIAKQIQKAAERNSGESAADILRRIANDARHTINNNPGTKINDLYGLYFLVPSKPAPKAIITIGPVTPGPLLPNPAPAPKPKLQPNTTRAYDYL